MLTHRSLSGGGAGGKVGRIVPAGKCFVDESGAVVARASITGFTLPKRFATGHGDDARRYLDFAAAHGLNEVRAFSRVDWTGPPGPGVESGWEYDEGACAEALAEAAARGLRVELVAHTGVPSGWNEARMADHLRRVDELCLAHPNALLEVWNEPQQNGGHELLGRVLALYEPRTPGWSSGAYTPTPYTAVVQVGTNPDNGRPIYAAAPGARVGPSMSYHSPRKYEWSRCTKDALEFGDGSGPEVYCETKFEGAVMLDEPPQVEQTIRDQTATAVAVDDWRAYGAGAKLFGCGGTVHGNPSFQKCEIPADQEAIACVDAFVAGMADVPTQRYHGYQRLDPPGSDPGSRRYRRNGEDGGTYEICVRPYAFARVA